MKSPSCYFVLFYSLFKAVRVKPIYSIKCKFYYEKNVCMPIYVVLRMLFSSVNIGCGRAEERFLLTGLHAVADIYCSSCKTTLGWKYVSIEHSFVYGSVIWGS